MDGWIIWTTFHNLIPYLDLNEIRFISVDMAGHGYSGHRPKGSIYHLLEYVVDCEALVREMDIKKFSILGHSLGGVVGAIWAAGNPSAVKHLLLIDSLGPHACNEDNAGDQFQLALSRAVKGPSAKKTIFERKDEAVKARMKGVGKLSYEAASILVNRSLTKTDQGYTWRSDSRLTHPSLSRLTEKQIISILSAVEAKTLSIIASKGLLSLGGKVLDRTKAFKNVEQVTIDGGHHLHLEDAAKDVALLINRFIKNNSN